MNHKAKGGDFVLKEYDQLTTVFSDFCKYLNEEAGYLIQIDKINAIRSLLAAIDIFNMQEVEGTLKSILCDSEQEYKAFSSLFETYFKNKGWIANIKQESERLQKVLLPKGIENWLNGLSDDKMAELIRAALECDKEKVKILMMGGKEFDQNGLELRQKRIDKFLMENTLKNIEGKNSEEIGEALVTASKVIKNAGIEVKEGQSRNCENQIEDDIGKSIVVRKDFARSHRENFAQGKNAIQVQRDTLDKTFLEITSKDLDIIENYFEENLPRLKKMLKGKNQKWRKKLDYKKTIKNAVKTNGTPIKLFYKAPKKEQTRLVCLTDISGSCRAASQILLSFVFSLQEMYSGGVESFVFVKDLARTTEYFKEYPLAEASKLAGQRVARTYSNYGVALRQFYDTYFDLLTKDTTVLILGDARSNKNRDLASPVLKAIKELLSEGKGKIVWMETEPKDKWGAGDSDIYKYIVYIDQVAQVTTTRDILTFMTEKTL